ncbi:MAG: efflux RND transporter periplasmic adaptor subunit [Muribaculaceae bacterium]|nr:efflux RND transporter periplasmic adaptor subunit [Muribaculaceae bacterium]
MNCFNYFKGVAMALPMLPALFISGCNSHDKPTQAPPVRVKVEVLAHASAGSSGGGVYSGTVESAEASVVGFSVPGTITDIYVKEGQKVAKGQVLARVKSESLNDERNIAVAELNEVRDLYNRLKKLHDANALPDVKWVEVQTRLQQAENAVALADRAVADATLTSPITGYVAEKLADEGQTVVPAQPVLKIVNLDRLQATVSVPETEIGSFGASRRAAVTFDALDGVAVDGQMAQKDVVADPLTRSYSVKFDIPSAGGKILPGMVCSVAVEGSTDSTAVATGYVLPSQALLLTSDNRQFVWTVRDSKARRVFVTADELTAGGVNVRSGLQPGDSVIVAGMQKVGTGTEVVAIAENIR